MGAGMALVQVVEPEKIVEVQIEQGAVHVQQYGVDLRPGQGLGHLGVCRHKNLRYHTRNCRTASEMRIKPEILACEEVARTHIFRVEQLRLKFSNGQQRTYERLRGKADGHGAVMVVALTSDLQAVLIQEYCAGSERHEWSVPKGLIDAGETPEQAANRELQRSE